MNSLTVTHNDDFINRFQPKAGPDGGNGGNGGSIVLISDYSVKELAHLPKHIKAENGGAGKGEDCKGRNGADCIFEVKCNNNSDDKNYYY